MPEIMTLKDVAEYLRVNERTVAKMAQEGTIPSMKVASQWRFSKEAIDMWFTSQMQHSARAAQGRAPRPELSDLISTETVKLDLESRDKASLLDEMSALLADSGVVSSQKRLLDALVERERLCSTGIGRGTAFLHPRRVIGEIVKRPALAFGRSSEGIEFEAVDREPVHFFFLDCATSDRMHLSLLARLSRVLSDGGLIVRLGEVERPEEVVEALKAAENRLITQ